MDTVAFKKQMNSILPDIDLEKGLKHSVQNILVYKKALYCALKSIRFKLPLLDSMIDTGEYAGLRVIIHTLCPLLSSIGADGFCQRGYALETAALNESSDVLQEKIIVYRNELAYFTKGLEEIIRTMDSISTSNDLRYAHTPEETRRLLREAFPSREEKVV